jgi:hypothetical protein
MKLIDMVFLAKMPTAQNNPLFLIEILRTQSERDYFYITHRLCEHETVVSYGGQSWHAHKDWQCLRLILYTEKILYTH